MGTVYRDNLCWHCSNATPKKNDYGRYVTGCEWSIKHKPVPNWKAARNDLMIDYREVESYHVHECPKFKEE